MAERITETLAKGLSAPPEGNRIVYDSDLKGFGLRITARGAKAFILNYRVHGRERRLTIGSYPDWSAAAARKYAGDLKRQIDLGNDPLLKRREERAALTVSELSKLYVERHLPRKREKSRREDQAIIETFVLPALGPRKAATIAYSDIEELHRRLSARAPYRANRAVALISKMFSLGIRWGAVSENPAKGVERNPEHPRHRYLDRGEIERISAVLTKWPNRAAANAIRLLLLTGARKSEVLGATWDQFDLVSGNWAKPAASVKQARLHRVPLPRAAIALLEKMARDRPQSPYLFPSRDLDHPIADIKKSWAAIRSEAGLPDVRLHDLRHTYASVLASQGKSLPIIGAMLGHTQPTTTNRYAHLLDDPLREAAEAAASMIDAPKQ